MKLKKSYLFKINMYQNMNLKEHLVWLYTVCWLQYLYNSEVEHPTNRGV